MDEIQGKSIDIFSNKKSHVLNRNKTKEINKKLKPNK